VMPGVFPEPESEAAAKYVGIVVRALGVDRSARQIKIARSAAGD